MDLADFDIFETKPELFHKMFDESNLFMILPPNYNTKVEASNADGWIIPRLERNIFMSTIKTNDDLLNFKKVTLSDFLSLDKGYLVNNENMRVDFEIWSTQMNWVTNERSMDRQFCLVSDSWYNEIQKIKLEDDESRQLEASLTEYAEKMREIQTKLDKKKVLLAEQIQIERLTKIENKKNAEKNAENAELEGKNLNRQVDRKEVDFQIPPEIINSEEFELMTEPVTQEVVTEDGQTVKLNYYPTDTDNSDF